MTHANVQRYLDGVAAPARGRLDELRAAITAAAPEAVETIAYGMPSFALDGRTVAHCAAFARHVSLFGITESIIAERAPELQGQSSGRGTLKFPLDEPVPVATVTDLVTARLARAD